MGILLQADTNHYGKHYTFISVVYKGTFSGATRRSRKCFTVKNATVKVAVDTSQKPQNSFEALCDALCADERSMEEIIRDIYESLIFGRESQ